MMNVAKVPFEAMPTGNLDTLEIDVETAVAAPTTSAAAVLLAAAGDYG